MLYVDLSIRDADGQAVVALRGQLSLADIPGVASHLIAAVAAWRAIGHRRPGGPGRHRLQRVDAEADVVPDAGGDYDVVLVAVRRISWPQHAPSSRSWPGSRP